MLLQSLIFVSACVFCLNISQASADNRKCAEILKQLRMNISEYNGLYSIWGDKHPFTEENWRASMEKLNLTDSPYIEEYLFLFRLHDNRPAYMGAAIVNVALMDPTKNGELAQDAGASEISRGIAYRQGLGPLQRTDILRIAVDWLRNERPFASKFFNPFWVRNFLTQLVPTAATQIIPEEVNLFLDLEIPAVDRQVAKLLSTDIALEHPEWLEKLLDRSRESSVGYNLEARDWGDRSPYFPVPGEPKTSATLPYSHSGRGVHQYTLSFAVGAVAQKPEWIIAQPRLVKWLASETLSPEQTLAKLVATDLGKNFLSSLTRPLTPSEVANPDELRELLDYGSHDLEIIDLVIKNNLVLSNDIIMEIYNHNQPKVVARLVVYARNILATASAAIVDLFLNNTPYNSLTQNEGRHILGRADAPAHLDWFEKISELSWHETPAYRIEYLLRVPHIFEGTGPLPFQVESLTDESVEILRREVLAKPTPTTNTALLVELATSKKLTPEQIKSLLMIFRWQQDYDLQKLCGGAPTPACLMGETGYWGRFQVWLRSH